MSDMEKLMEGFTEGIKNLTDKMDNFSTKLDEVNNIDEKVEKALKDKAESNVSKAFVQEREEESKEVGKYYGFLNARNEVAKGLTASAPLWSDDQNKRFVEWAIAVKENDKDTIKKAFGDNPYTETTSAGGYLVPDEFRPEILRLAYQKSIALQRCRIIPMNTDKLTIPTISSGYSASWGSINTQITDQKLGFGQSELTAEKLVGLSLVPNELLNDSALPIASLLADEFAEAFAKKIDEEVFDGDSSDTANHKFDGWGYASDVNEVQPSADGSPTLEKLFTVDNIMSALEYIDDKDLEGAQWYFHPTVWNVIRNLQGNVSDGSGGTIKSGLPLVNIDQNYKYNLLGYPVNRTSQAPKGGSPSNDVPAGFFGNMKNIIIGDRMSLAVQADSSERFSYDQTIFRATQRLAIDVAVPAGLVKFQMPTSS